MLSYQARNVNQRTPLIESQRYQKDTKKSLNNAKKDSLAIDFCYDIVEKEVKNGRTEKDLRDLQVFPPALYPEG